MPRKTTTRTTSTHTSGRTPMDRAARRTTRAAAGTTPTMSTTTRTTRRSSRRAGLHLTPDYSTLSLAADQSAFVPTARVPFLLEAMGAPCSEDQVLRELVVNGFEAIAAVERWGRGVTREVLVAPELINGVPKLSVIDNGVGMPLEQLLALRQLMTSSKDQGVHANFGVGARLTTARTSPFGAVYRSWRDGVGHEITMRLDGGGLGLVQYPSGEAHRTLTMTDAPEVVRAVGHGTQVVLLGHAPEDDTWAADPDGPYPSRQLASVLERRFAALPRGVELVVAESPHRKPGTRGRRFTRRSVKGALVHLRKQAAEAGSLELETPVGMFQVQWWLAGGSANHTHVPLSSVAMRHRDELLDRVEGAEAERRLRAFGLSAIAGRMTIHALPYGELTQDVSRTHIQVDGQLVSWEAIGEAFAEQMPEVLVEAIRAKLGRSRKRKDEDRYRSEKYAGLFQLVRQLMARPGREHLESEEVEMPVLPPSHGLDGTGEGGGGTKRPKPEKASMGLSLPQVTVAWVSAAEGTRDPGEMEGFAGRFEPGLNVVVMNRDWPGFASMHAWVLKGLLEHEKNGTRYRRIGAKALAGEVTETLERLYAQNVIEAVVYQLATRGVDGESATPAEMYELVTPMTITMAVSPRTSMAHQAMGSLGSQLKHC